MALTRAQMDAKLDEHFGFEATDNVEGVIVKGSGHWLIDEAPGRRDATSRSRSTASTVYRAA